MKLITEYCLIDYLQFFCQEVCNKNCQTGKQRSQEYAYISNMDCDIDQMQNMVKQRRCYHQA